MNWLEQIRNLLPHQLAVEHQPETPRYSRARSKLRHIVNRGKYLGKREEKERTLEIAVWTPPEHGRGTGYYCCFRVYFKDDELLYAVLFCFYDGTEKSPGFRSFESALAFAKSEDFYGDNNENAH